MQKEKVVLIKFTTLFFFLSMDFNAYYAQYKRTPLFKTRSVFYYFLGHFNGDDTI